MRGYARDAAGPLADRRRLLKGMIYNDSRFREAGETDAAGWLRLTDEGELPAPVLVPPGQRADPANPGTQLLGRFRTFVMDEESVVLSRPTGRPGDAADLRSVDLLVQPSVLSEPFAAADFGPTDYLAFARAADGQLLDGVGALPVRGGLLVPGDPAGRLRAEATSADGAVRVVAEVSAGWAARTGPANSPSARR